MRAAAATLITLAAATPACADTDFLGGAVTGLLDFRASAVGGELGWAEGGFGKLRYGGHGDDTVGRTDLARGAVVWRTHVAWSVSGYLHLEIDPDTDHLVDIGEAYVTVKPVPKSSVSTWLRLGAFYPPVSLEHDGEAWSTTRTITPSAINSWIGEEVKLAGAEASVRGAAPGGSGEFTGAVFGANDTSGTLLTFRGWALHDRQTSLLGDVPLPTRTPSYWAVRSSQARDTQPFREVDDLPGYYLRAEYRADVAPVAFNAFYYNNEGNRRAVDAGQSSWHTEFVNLGLEMRLADGLELLAQAMNGRTVWAPLTGARIRYVDDMDFSSAYVMLDRDLGDQGLAARVDWFETRDNQAFNYNSVPEQGWAMTAAWRRPLSARAKILAEGVYIDSERSARASIGDNPRQSQLALQASLRWSF